MSTRAIAVVAVLSVFAPKMPEQCNKMLGKAAPPASAEPLPPPPPPPPLSATTPPAYFPPEPNPPTSTGSSGATHKPTASEVETQAAKAAMEKKKYKDARTILEKKVKAGTSTPEDLLMLKDACEKLKDTKCLTALAKVPGSPLAE
jgi:hypothetical protein